MRNKTEVKFTNKELEFMYTTIRLNCNPIFDHGTEKLKLTKSVMKKLENY